MKIKNVKSYLLGLLLTFFLWYLQMWTIDGTYEKYPFPFNLHSELGQIYVILYHHKIGIGIITFLTLGVYQALVIKRVGDKKEKQLIKSILSNMLFEKFQGNIPNTRITVFKIKNGYSFYFHYIWRCFVVNYKNHKDKKILENHFKLRPKLFKKYLVVYTRKSNPQEDGSSTFFPVVNDPDKICGIPSHSVYHGAPSKMENQSIADIDLRSVRTMAEVDAHPQSRRIKRYMINTKIKDFNRLKCMHRLSNCIWANPIFDKNENPWGAIVVDIDSDCNYNFNSIEKDLISYTKIIGLSIIHLN